MLDRAPRSTVRRKADRASYDRAAVEAVLDEALVAHIAFEMNGQPYVLPANCWRVGERLCFHFGRRSRIADVLASGAEISVAVTLLDGLVLARSALHHSMNYRSAVLFGRAEPVEDPAEKANLLMALVEKLYPGRSAEVRAPDAKELAITAVAALRIAEGAVKARSGPSSERPDDLALPVWSGVIPLRLATGTPQPDDHGPAGLPPPIVAIPGLKE